MCLGALMQANNSKYTKEDTGKHILHGKLENLRLDFTENNFNGLILKDLVSVNKNMMPRI